MCKRDEEFGKCKGNFEGFLIRMPGGLSRIHTFYSSFPVAPRTFGMIRGSKIFF
jgi:hypothetical protein